MRIPDRYRSALGPQVCEDLECPESAAASLRIVPGGAVLITGGAYGGSYHYSGEEIERGPKGYRLIGRGWWRSRLRDVLEHIDLLQAQDEEEPPPSGQAYERTISDVAAEQGWEPVEALGPGRAWFKAAAEEPRQPRWDAEAKRWVAP